MLQVRAIHGHEVEIRILCPRTMGEAQMQTVGIIGLGYVGLPTAIGFHDAGFEVWGSTSQNAR